MTYVLVTISSIDDRDLFREYARKVAPLIERHGGKYLAIDCGPEVKGGEWAYLRTVIIGFPSAEAAQRWYDSPEYQEIVPLRLKAITANVVFVRDLSETSSRAA
jgi:uncharacterized protein (DUF1330 family)